MVGRIPIIDVTPLVDRGRLPAKAVVGEPFPVDRDGLPRGSRQLGAEVVLIDPDGASGAPPVRMTTRAEAPDRYDGLGHPRPPGAWTFEVAGVVATRWRPGSTTPRSRSRPRSTSS